MKNLATIILVSSAVASAALAGCTTPNYGNQGVNVPGDSTSRQARHTDTRTDIAAGQKR